MQRHVKHEIRGVTEAGGGGKSGGTRRKRDVRRNARHVFVRSARIRQIQLYYARLVVMRPPTRSLADQTVCNRLYFISLLIAAVSPNAAIKRGRYYAARLIVPARNKRPRRRRSRASEPILANVPNTRLEFSTTSP